MFSAIRIYVTNGFLPGMAWANLFLRISFDVAFQSGVQRTVLCCFGTCHSQRRLLVVALRSALYGVDIHHPVRSVLRTVLHRFRTCNPKRRPPLSLSDESFPNEDATSASRSLQEASMNPSWVWMKPPRSLQRPRRLHKALVKTSRTLRGGATASPLRECFMKAP